MSIYPAARAVAPILVPLALVLGCGRTPETPVSPTPPAGPQTATFSGTASISAAGGCSSPGHTVSAGEGTITVALTQGSAASVAVQVCHPGAVDHARECSVPPFASLAVGASLSAPLRGGRSQTVTVYPDGCGRAGPVVPTSVTYSISVSFPG